MESGAPPSAAFYNFVGWLDVNKKRVAVGAAIVVFIALVVAVLVWRHSEREGEAARALSAVRVPFNPLDPIPPGTAEAFLKVASDYSGTPAAARAAFSAASVYFVSGQYPQAQQQFNNFLSKHGDTPWVPQARYGLAASVDAQGNVQDAIAKYNDFIRAYPNDPAVDDARLNLARLYEKSNQPTQALDLLNRMTNATPFSATGAEVQDRLKTIYAKYPDLAPKPVAPAPGPALAPRDVPLMLRDVPRTPQPSPTPTVPTPAAPNISVPASTSGAPKIILQTPPGQNNPPGK